MKVKIVVRAFKMPGARKGIAAEIDRVLEIGAGGGYYTELFSHMVGDERLVYAYNPYFFLGFVSDQVVERYGNGELKNVVLTVGSPLRLDLNSDAYDKAYFIDIYHDIYYSDETEEEISPQGHASLAEVYRIVNPGGVIGVIDHRAAKDVFRAEAAKLHRITENNLRRDFETAGFEFTGKA